MSRLTQVLEFLQDNALTIVREASINLVLPYLIYNYAQPHIGEVNALIASSAPPILWSIYEFARHRRIDALSLFVLFGIVLSLLAFVGGGSVKFLQLREKLGTALFGIMFLGSAAIGRPLIYELARAGMARANDHEEVERFEELREDIFFKGSMTIMTLVWGFGLLADAALSIVLVYTLSVREYLIVSPIIGYSTMGLLALWTFWFARRRRARGDAMRAEAQARNAEAPLEKPSTT